MGVAHPHSSTSNDPARITVAGLSSKASLKHNSLITLRTRTQTHNSDPNPDPLSLGCVVQFFLWAGLFCFWKDCFSTSALIYVIDNATFLLRDKKMFTCALQFEFVHLKLVFFLPIAGNELQFAQMIAVPLLVSRLLL